MGWWGGSGEEKGGWGYSGSEDDDGDIDADVQMIVALAGDVGNEEIVVFQWSLSIST